MLTRFTIENYKSFDAATELNMVSSSKIRTKTEHQKQVRRNMKILKHAAVYGANASGKSNLVNAVAFFSRVVVNGLPLDTSRLYCRSRETNRMRNSIFEMQLELSGSFYAYGFSALLSERRITGEWLYELHASNGSATCIFERSEDKAPILGERFFLSEEEKIRFNTYAEDFTGNSVNLFLNEMNRGKKYPEESRLKVLEKVFRNIKDQIIIITPDSRLVNFQQYYNSESLTEINRLIQTFDTGVSDVHVEEIDSKELERQIPKEILNTLKDTLSQKQNENPKVPVSMSGRSNNAFFNIEVEIDGEMKISTIKMKHGKSLSDFCFDEESDGTKRLFDLMDMLLKKSEDTVFFVDELERSLHPKLTEHFLELFSQYHASHSVQLVFTTHEASIMDQELFRRDEIWFVERDGENNSSLYSLDRFKERYDKKLSKAYLEGRYGAIPVFKRFTFTEDN